MGQEMGPWTTLYIQGRSCVRKTQPGPNHLSVSRGFFMKLHLCVMDSLVDTGLATTYLLTYK